MTPYGIFLSMAEDNRTFCLAGALSKHDPLRRSLGDPELFNRVMLALPSLRDWVSAGEPISDVHLMGGLANRRRVIGSGPKVPAGFVLIGDASLYTNATFGQGAALGCWQAQALAERSDLISGGTDLLTSMEAWTRQALDPLYEAQVAVDEGMITALRDGVAGAPMTTTPNPRDALLHLGAAGDAEARQAFNRIDNLLTGFDQELSGTALGARVSRFMSTMPEGPTGPGPLPRPEFERILSRS